eukprot:scaffold12456_cov36-Tisochrysis_lutea.AAC.5
MVFLEGSRRSHPTRGPPSEFYCCVSITLVLRDRSPSTAAEQQSPYPTMGLCAVGALAPVSSDVRCKKKILTTSTKHKLPATRTACGIVLILFLSTTYPPPPIHTPFPPPRFSLVCGIPGVGEIARAASTRGVSAK